MPKDIETIKNNAAIAQFRFAIIAPVTVILFRCSNHIFYFSPFYRVHLSCFCNHRSVVLYCQTPSMLICHFCEVPVYTLKGRRRVYVVETVYIIHFQPYLRRHYEQIMQIFHSRHPVFMYLSSPRQVYSTEKLRSRNRHFSRYFHDSINRNKIILIFTDDSVLNRTLAE